MIYENAQKYILPPSVPPIADAERTVGITTTVPIEVIYAANFIPMDLNNLFVSSSGAEGFIRTAERCGFPRTSCSWTKGIYGAARHHGIRRVVVVVQGDCSNNHALAQMLEDEGVECIPFAFPYRPDIREMKEQIERFAKKLHISIPDSELWRERLVDARRAAHEIDRLTWQEGKVHGLENHLWLVSASDFGSSPALYGEEAQGFLQKARAREASRPRIRLGLAGVPPIVPALYEFLESLGARVVYNETQHQFTMPAGGDTLAQQYSAYTYPYGIRCRLREICRETQRRRLDGLIHYVQSFCYRRVEDRALREGIPIPVLTLEQDRPGPVTGQLRTRLEAFAELLWSRKSGHSVF